MAKNNAPLFDDDDLTGGPSPEAAARLATIITVFLGLVALGFAGWYISGYLKNAGNEERTAQYTEVLVEFQTGLNDEDTTSRLTKLLNAGTKAENLAATFGNNSLGFQTLLLAGNSRFEAAYGQQPDKAREVLKAALASYDKALSIAMEDQSRAVAHLARANTYDNLGFLGEVTMASEANKAYAEASRIGRGTAVDLEARLGTARLLVAQVGRENEARPLLQSVVNESRALMESGITGDMLAANDVTTFSIRTPSRSVTRSQKEMESLRRMQYASLGGFAQELLDRLPALAGGTTESLTAATTK
jgi:hypothetical protein